tara:strand:+ start:18 stop:605 length:588 start_codon:yes stop_codon:yes gene_type:complete
MSYDKKNRINIPRLNKFSKYKKDILYYEKQHNPQHRTNKESWFVYGYIVGARSDSVFELGCNVGRHLYQLDRLGLDVFGVDPVERFILEGRSKYGLGDKIVCDDHRCLRDMVSNSFDTCMTVSVLNHIHDVKGIVEQLKRVCSNNIIICESFNKNKGKAPWYIHNYEELGFEKLRNHNSNVTSDAEYAVYVWNKQ